MNVIAQIVCCVEVKTMGENQVLNFFGVGHLHHVFMLLAMILAAKMVNDWHWTGVTIEGLPMQALTGSHLFFSWYLFWSVLPLKAFPTEVLAGLILFGFPGLIFFSLIALSILVPRKVEIDPWWTIFHATFTLYILCSFAYMGLVAVVVLFFLTILGLFFNGARFSRRYY